MAYKVTGTVVEGNRIGRRIGFPTANIHPTEPVLAEDGVYAVTVTVGGESREGMANLGLRPSVDSGDAGRVLEVHIFDFCADIYGQRVEVELCRRIRGELRFASLDDLRAQLVKDMNEIKGFFNR